MTVKALGCNGMCPQYELEIDGRGTATLNARRHLPFAGQQTATIDLKTVQSLLQADDFWTLSCIRQADEDTVIIEVADGTRMKRLSCSASPLRDEPFARLVTDIHAFVTNEQWVKP